MFKKTSAVTINPFPGLLVYGQNHLLSVVLDASTKICAGDVVTLSTTATGQHHDGAIVVKKASNTDQPFGVLPYKTLLNRYTGDFHHTDIALPGSIIYLKACENVDIGDSLEASITESAGSQVKKKTTNGKLLGQALCKASKNDFVKVKLQF